MDSQNTAYPHVRALARGLMILRSLNELGRSTPAKLAAATQLDRTTTYRLLATLEREGYVQRSRSTDEYYLLPAVQGLSSGYQKRNAVSAILNDELGKLVDEILWPSDFMTYEGGDMVIRETTHAASAYSIYRGMVGGRLPLLSSAAGRAMLAGSSAEDRQHMLETARIMADLHGSDAELQMILRDLEKDFTRRGYSWSVGGDKNPISAIALPVRLSEHKVGAVNILFFTSAMSVTEAARRYLPNLRQCVSQIEQRVADIRP